MGLFDSLASMGPCPHCGTRTARKILWIVKCTNTSCPKYDPEFASAFSANRIVGKTAEEVFPHLKGDFDPGHGAVRIRYANFRGDELTYLGDPRTAYKQGQHLVIRVAPSGKRIALRLSSIQNRSDIESQMEIAPVPDSNERRILNFHLKRGTTSTRFEELRKTYPEYRP